MPGLVLVAALCACGNSTAPSAQERIEGQWDWVESRGGFAGVTQTPASTGETMELRFDDGVVELYRGGDLQSTTTYTIAPVQNEGTGEGPGAGDEVRYEEPIFGFDTQDVTFEGEDVLILTDPCCDGFVYRFERS